MSSSYVSIYDLWFMIYVVSHAPRFTIYSAQEINHKSENINERLANYLAAVDDVDATLGDGLYAATHEVIDYF